jgi:hypothetical protein
VHLPTLGRRAAAAILVATSAIVTWHLAGKVGLWARPSTLAVSALLAAATVAAVVTLWTGSVHRRLVGAALLWMHAGITSDVSWALCVGTLGALVVLLTLVGGDVAGEDRLAASEQVWTRPEPLVTWMRAASITALMAGLMAIVYAYVQHGAVPSLRLPAVALALYLAVAALLSMRGRVLGGVLLAIGGVLLVGLSIAVAVQTAPAARVQLAGYYLMFWTPAAACGLCLGAALSRAALRR